MNKLLIQFELVIILAILPLFAKTQNVCDFIKNIQNYQDSVELKFDSDYDIIDSTTFNIYTYLGFFDNIVVKERMRIDVYFMDNILDGEPYLYAIRENLFLWPLIDSLSKNQRREDNVDLKIQERDILYGFLNDPNTRAKNNIRPKDSKNGFFQYLFFSEMGENFALKWHSNYDDKFIICSSEMLNDFIERYRDSKWFKLDSISLPKLKSISVHPIIKKGKEYYKIIWIEIRTHSGIYKCTFKINRKVPYEISKIREEKILEITTNFVY